MQRSLSSEEPDEKSARFVRAPVGYADSAPVVLGGAQKDKLSGGGGPGDVFEAELRRSLVLELAASDYAGGSTWPSRSRGQPDAFVPDGVRFDKRELAFLFEAGGEVVTVPLATSPVMHANVTYAAWVKVLEPFPPGNLGWFLAQSPDYSWSRALTLNDYRLGHVSITTSGYWDSDLGRAPVGCWLHVVGVWRQGGDSTAYLNGIEGSTVTPRNGRGSDPNEALVIGGRAARDAVHNAAVAVSDVCVYSRALDSLEVAYLHARGRSGHGLSPAAAAAAAASIYSSVTRCASKASASPSAASPAWDEEARVFWYDTGINAYDLPDGGEWQREFRAAVEASATGPAGGRIGAGGYSASAGASAPSGLPGENLFGVACSVRLPGSRVLQQQLSDTPTCGPSPTAKSRQLARHGSDPERSTRRAVHTAALRRMPQRAGIALRVQDRYLALFRFDGCVYAVDAMCPHQGGNLVEGEVGDIEDMVEGHRRYVTCPVHKFQFDLSSGVVLQGKCDSLKTYKVRVREGRRGREAAIVEVGLEALGGDFFAEYDVDDF